MLRREDEEDASSECNGQLLEKDKRLLRFNGIWVTLKTKDRPLLRLKGEGGKECAPPHLPRHVLLEHPFFSWTKGLTTTTKQRTANISSTSAACPLLRIELPCGTTDFAATLDMSDGPPTTVLHKENCLVHESRIDRLFKQRRREW